MLFEYKALILEIKGIKALLLLCIWKKIFLQIESTFFILKDMNEVYRYYSYIIV